MQIGCGRQRGCAVAVERRALRQRNILEPREPHRRGGGEHRRVAVAQHTVEIGLGLDLQAAQLRHALIVERDRDPRRRAREAERQPRGAGPASRLDLDVHRKARDAAQQRRVALQRRFAQGPLGGEPAAIGLDERRIAGRRAMQVHLLDEALIGGDPHIAAGEVLVRHDDGVETDIARGIERGQRVGQVLERRAIQGCADERPRRLRERCRVQGRAEDFDMPDDIVLRRRRCRKQQQGGEKRTGEASDGHACRSRRMRKEKRPGQVGGLAQAEELSGRGG